MKAITIINKEETGFLIVLSENIKDEDRVVVDKDGNKVSFYTREEARNYIDAMATEVIHRMYPENIIGDIRENLDVKRDDESKDYTIMNMSKSEVLERVCVWNGLIGYDDTIKNWIESIYGVELKD